MHVLPPALEDVVEACAGAEPIAAIEHKARASAPGA